MSVITEVREPPGLGFKKHTIFLIGVSATDGDMEVVAPDITTPAPSPSVQTATQAFGDALAAGGCGMPGEDLA